VSAPFVAHCCAKGVIQISASVSVAAKGDPTGLTGHPFGPSITGPTTMVFLSAVSASCYERSSRLGQDRGAVLYEGLMAPSADADSVRWSPWRDVCFGCA